MNPKHATTQGRGGQGGKGGQQRHAGQQRQQQRQPGQQRQQGNVFSGGLQVASKKDSSSPKVAAVKGGDEKKPE